MDRFNFVLDPLDIALRRLLMDLCLPKETQQIDRVMEAFAKRYADCNPGLFVSEGMSEDLIVHTGAN
jgi:Sec7-like guanine-nucleotide exchange factor